MRETYTKEWEPWEGAPTPKPSNPFDELVDLLLEEARNGAVEWWDGTPVFDNARYKEVQQ